MGGHGSAKPSPVFPIDNREKKTRSRGVNAHTGVLRLVAITGWPLHPATDHLSPASSTGGLATWGRVLKSICSTLRVRQHTGSRVPRRMPAAKPCRRGRTSSAETTGISLISPAHTQGASLCEQPVAGGEVVLRRHEPQIAKLLLMLLLGENDGRRHPCSRVSAVSAEPAGAPPDLPPGWRVDS